MRVCVCVCVCVWCVCVVTYLVPIKCCCACVVLLLQAHSGVHLVVAVKEILSLPVTAHLRNDTICAHAHVQAYMYMYTVYHRHANSTLYSEISLFWMCEYIVHVHMYT